MARRPSTTRLTNREQTTTQAFYYVNHFHDHLLAPPIGFDEASRNFEHVNSSGQGLGGDAIDVLTTLTQLPERPVCTRTPTAPCRQMRLGHRSARHTPYDVRMQRLCRCSSTTSTRTASSDRLVGAGTGSVAGVRGKALVRGLGRLVRDWTWSSVRASIADGARAGRRPIRRLPRRGNVLRSEPTRLHGRRKCCDLPRGGHGGQSGGYTFGDFGRVNDAFPFEEHVNGEIWAQTLWDLRTRVGGQTARCLVTGGLRLSPASPGFLDSRDSILQSTRSWSACRRRPCGRSSRPVAWASTRPKPPCTPDEDFTVPSDLPPPPTPTGSCGTAEPPGRRWARASAQRHPGGRLDHRRPNRRPNRLRAGCGPQADRQGAQEAPHRTATQAPRLHRQGPPRSHCRALCARADGQRSARTRRARVGHESDDRQGVAHGERGGALLAEDKAHEQGQAATAPRPPGQRDAHPGLHAALGTIAEALRDGEASALRKRAICWAFQWAGEDSNHRPTDYESAALTN